MVQIANSQVQPMLYLYEMWKTKGDKENSKRIHDVIQKYVNNEFMIAFCGHFSAGKSTMLNELYGEDLLPTSPIPTSANVVKIKRGENRVIVTLKSGEKHAFEGAYTDQQLKQLFKNGEEVIGVQISRDDASLPEGVMLVDTPGIDSTDDAHKLATESTLHLADVIFYMMDYNHVQSQVNLQFVKELKERKKTVYLVINQIDKHKEEELSFSAYADSVKQSFLNWNIEVDGIFYTTLRNPSHAYNELHQLKNLLATIMENRNKYLEESVRREVSYLLHKHEESLRKENISNANSSSVSVEEAEQELQNLYEREQVFSHKEENVKSVFLKGIDHILQNAYLLPYDVRELAKAYLETELSNFKVGILFSKAKTQKEKEQRLHNFYEKISQTAEAQLDVHIKQYILSFIQEHNIYTEELAKEVYEISTSFEMSLLTENVKRGAVLSGDYVLNYTNDVATSIKGIVRKQANLFYDERVASLLKGKWKVELADLQQKIHSLEEKFATLTEGRESERQLTNYLQDLINVWEGHKQPEVQRSLDLLEEQVVSISKQPMFLEQAEKETYSEHTKREEEVHDTGAAEAEERVQVITKHIREAEGIIQPFTALRHLYEEITEKRTRIETKQFTVALFGAFSAGKSSFANALLGSKVLPVSPNPTTATINKIVPVTKENPHGTVRIKLKSEEILFEDLQRVYKIFEKSVSSLQDAVQGIGDLLKQSAPSARQKTTLSFLRAVRTGYAFFSDKLGQMLTTDLSEFASFVAMEEKSCFVEFMELYYDCELTRKGVTIVDTPGADSVNARHTDVAFQYIKNADAILFVTYYNHVFSRADREFLIQLGRVKDSFAMDKMFFIINAADLASTKEELQTVQDYIRSQLVQYGIRDPRLFALSSLYALEEKQNTTRGEGMYGVLTQSGIAPFEESFTRFIMRDLMLVSVSALQSTVKASYSLLSNILSNATAGIEEKEKKRRLYEQDKAALLDTIASYNVLTEEQALIQEIRELLYYVKQRVMLRFNDIFTEFFNPATLRADKGDFKQSLHECLLEMIDFLKNDLTQEMRATSLRIESWMNKKLQFSAEGLQKQCIQKAESVSFSSIDQFEFASAIHKEPFEQLELHQFKKAMSYFKNAKSFFEKNDKVLMQEEMKNVFDAPMSTYTQEEESIVVNHYKNEWQLAWQKVKDKLQEDVLQYYAGVLFALSENIDIASYEAAKDKLHHTITVIEHDINML